MDYPGEGKVQICGLDSLCIIHWCWVIVGGHLVGVWMSFVSSCALLCVGHLVCGGWLMFVGNDYGLQVLSIVCGPWVVVCGPWVVICGCQIVICGHSQVVYVIQGWGLMFVGMGAWLLFLGTLVLWHVLCHVLYGHR